MAALDHIQPLTPAGGAAEAPAEPPLRLAGADDRAVASPAQRLQARLQFDLSQQVQTRRWPPIATLALAGIPSLAAWWGLFVIGRTVIRLVQH